MLIKAQMGATETLRDDHKLAWRLESIIITCVKEMNARNKVPIDDITKITEIIDGFLDSIHHSREEDTYFPCVSAYGKSEEIRMFLIEHEFGRRVAHKIVEHAARWRKGEDAKESVSRYLQAYAVFLRDHMTKEEKFFKDAQDIISPQEDAEMNEYFKSVLISSKSIVRIESEISTLENASWYTQAL